MSLIEQILDENSFVEQGGRILDAFIRSGYGTINSRLVYIYEQTGYVTVNHAEKIQKVYDKALVYGAPVIAVLNSSGMRLDDGLTGLNAYSKIFTNQAKAHGKVSQIAVVEGDALGACAVIAALSDFVITSEKSRIFLQSPDILKNPSKNVYTHIVAKDLSESVKKLMSFIPSNANSLEHYSECADDLNRESNLTEKSTVCEIIQEIADGREFIRLLPKFGEGVETALAKLSGMTVGIVAAYDALTVLGIKKIGHIIKYCSNFRVPIIFINDNLTYGSESDDALMLYDIANLIGEINDAKVGKILLATKNVQGSLYAALNNKYLDIDVSYAWENACFSLFDETGGQKITGGTHSYTAHNAAELGFVDDIIDVTSTRKRLIAALEMIFIKNVNY
ncbi:methylmalonyl-CoA carboxyltransferase [Clostridia bacterium]|nr:methylmalonyl-CoA carboxyltransferase [Clostridia bacterium]